MTLKPSGPDVVRPNTLRDQTEPNTFKGTRAAGSPAGSGASTGWSPPANLTDRRIPGWLIRAVISFAIVIAVYLLLSTT
jgi:hypothetical protein